MDIVKKALKLGADDVIVESLKGKFNQVKFANNTITVSQSWDIFRYNIFLTLKKRIVNTTIYDVSKKSIEKTVKSLVKAAKLIKPNKDYFGIAKGPFRYKPVGELYDKKIENVSGVDIVESAVNSALQYSKKTAGVFYSGLYHRNIETSSKISASDKTTSISISIRAFNKKDESGHGVSASRVLNKFNPESAGEKSGEIAELAKKPHKGEEGRFDVIFDPLAIADLLSLIGRFSSAFTVDLGFSFLRDKLGKRVGSKIVNLIDDGRMNNGFNSYTFDDEGVPTKTTIIINKGILKTYLHNTSTAKKHKIKTTGNAGLIAPEPTNIILKPGKYSKESLFKNVRNGLYVTNIWYTRFQNYLTGDFSTIPRDGIFLIKNGEIVRSLKGIRISDNLQRILLNIIRISNKPEWIQRWASENPVFTPYVIVKDVNVTLPTM